jgi:hypothetical protein
MILKKLFIILIFLFIGLIEVKANADTGNCTQPFTDIPCDFWAINEITWAKNRGITTGYPDGTYRPYEPIKRDAMAAFIVRALFGDNPTCQGGVPCESTQPYFKDVDQSQPFFKHIQKMYEAGITKGWPDGTYRPYENIRRDAMAAFLIRALGYGDNPICSGGVPCENTQPYFMDVPPTYPFYKHIQKLKELGITTGCQSNPPMYCPDNYVTRDAMAVFLYRGFLSNSSNSSVGAMMLFSGPFGAIMVGKGGEVLLPIVERDASGNPVKVTGALYMNGEIGNNLLVYFDNDGRPAKAFMGDFIILYSNWSADNKTVDIAIIYTPTDYIEIMRGIKVNTNSTMEHSSAFLQNFSQLTTNLSNDTSRQLATCFPPYCDTEIQNLAAILKIAGLGVSAASCLGAALSSAGILTPLIIPCTGYLVSTATFLMGDEAWLGLQGLEAGFSANDGFECLGGKILSCVSYILYVGSKLLDKYDEVSNKEKSYDIMAAYKALYAGNSSGIVQLGNGTPPVLPPKYECIPGGSMDWVPCLLGGARKCQPDYTYGPCMCNNGTTLCEYCGDGRCNKLQGENSITCPSDCPPICGNGICEKGENYDSCPSDCLLCDSNSCMYICLGIWAKCIDYCSQFQDDSFVECIELCGEIYENCPSKTNIDTCACYK